MNVMNYNGFSARIEYSDEDGLFVGHIAGIMDVVGFHGESVKELRTAFEEAVTRLSGDLRETRSHPTETLFRPSQSASGPSPSRDGCRESSASPQKYQSVGR